MLVWAFLEDGDGSVQVFAEGGSGAGSALPLPATAPYAADVANADALPSNAVDWVLLELRAGIESNASLPVSAILREDGRIVMPDGGETVYLEGKG